MLENTLNLELGFTSTDRDRAAVEREAMELSAFYGLPVGVWRDADGYTGFVVEIGIDYEQERLMPGCELVTVVQAN